MLSKLALLYYKQIALNSVEGEHVFMASQTIVALGGNVLKHFRVERDFGAGTTYLEQHTQTDQHDMDMVGLVLSPYTDGTYRITAVANRNDFQVLRSIKPNDRLLQIDGQDVQARSLNYVVDTLRGGPGNVHTLLLEREGEKFTVNAPTAHIL